MSWPRLAVLVHGGPGSVERVRARGLTEGWPEGGLLILERTGSRVGTAWGWWRELERFGPEVVYVINTAMPGAVLAPVWSWRRGVPYVLDTGDVIHEMAVRSGVTPRWKWPLLRAFEGWAQRRAARVVVRGSRHREHLRGLGYPAVDLIRDGCHAGAEPDPGEVARLRRALGLEGYTVLGVMGSLVFSPRLRICYGWDLIEALAELSDLPVRGLIIGDGDGREFLEARARALGVRERVVFTGRIPYEAVPQHLRLMDFAMSTQTNNLPGQVRTTGKLPEYMAQGRFILASRVGEAVELLPEAMLVEYEGEVDRGYPGRVAARVREVMGDPGRLGMGEELREVVARTCGYAVLRREFGEVIRRTVTDQRSRR